MCALCVEWSCSGGSRAGAGRRVLVGVGRARGVDLRVSLLWRVAYAKMRICAYTWGVCVCGWGWLGVEVVVEDGCAHVREVGVAFLGVDGVGKDGGGGVVVEVEEEAGAGKAVVEGDGGGGRGGDAPGEASPVGAFGIPGGEGEFFCGVGMVVVAVEEDFTEGEEVVEGEKATGVSCCAAEELGVAVVGDALDPLVVVATACGDDLGLGMVGSETCRGGEAELGADVVGEEVGEGIAENAFEDGAEEDVGPVTVADGVPGRMFEGFFEDELWEGIEGRVAVEACGLCESCGVGEKVGDGELAAG